LVHFLRQLRPFGFRRVAPWLGAAGAITVAGAVLFQLNGSMWFLPFSACQTEKHHVTADVERAFPPVHVVDAKALGEPDGRRCRFAVWEVRTTGGRFVVFTHPIEGVRGSDDAAYRQLVRTHLKHEMC